MCTHIANCHPTAECGSKHAICPKGGLQYTVVIHMYGGACSARRTRCNYRLHVQQVMPNSGTIVQGLPFQPNSSHSQTPSTNSFHKTCVCLLFMPNTLFPPTVHARGRPQRLRGCRQAARVSGGQHPAAAGLGRGQQEENGYVSCHFKCAAWVCTLVITHSAIVLAPMPRPCTPMPLIAHATSSMPTWDTCLSFAP